MSRPRREPDTPPLSPGEATAAAERDSPEETPEAPPDEQIETEGEAELGRDRPPEPVEPEPEREPVEPVSSSTRRKRQRALERRIHEWLGRIETAEDPSSPSGRREYATGVAGLLYVFDPFDGTVIALHAPNMARAYAQLADESPRFARFLELAMSGGATGAAIFATIPPLLAIAAHHGVDLTSPLRQIQARRAAAFTIPVEPDGTAHYEHPETPQPPPPSA